MHKDGQNISLRFALAFPDVYEVGMSYLGQKILYKILNQRKNIWAERVFAPSLQVAKILGEYKKELSTLESDTPLRQMDVLGFSLTHELSYSTFLYMLDLSNIPFRARDRGEKSPLIIAGGAVFNPEPVAPFFDLFVLGDGEELLLEISDILLNAKDKKYSRERTLRELDALPGIYIPSFLQKNYPSTTREKEVEKRLLSDLNKAEFPTEQIVPFGKAVHDRFTLEIARGCSRGCRFCQAGTTDRPVRERSLSELADIVSQGLEQTGFEEISFLSLSPGDFSGLEALFEQCFEQCRRKQVSISLPSLRAGSLNPALMSMLCSIKKTGATIAPEAGTERLRAVINKNISEQELLEHTHSLFELGWNNIKLYFMIGLPSETWEDIQGIFELCEKILSTAQNRKRTHITASISPFVPKPHTPFQWEEQANVQLIQEKIKYLQKLFSGKGKLSLKWQDPYMSFLEGVFSRGGRELAEAVEKAYRQGDVFTSWQETFNLDTWMQVFTDIQITPQDYLHGRDPETPLPWEHLNLGISRDFLKREKDLAEKAKQTPDCRYNICLECGICNHRSKSSQLHAQDGHKQIFPRLNRTFRDQEQSSPETESRNEIDLGYKSQLVKLWFTKQFGAKHLSQLELQSVLERTLRRAELPLSFSQGFNPRPLISFGRALPVGICSVCEWCELYLRSKTALAETLDLLNCKTISGIEFIDLEELDSWDTLQTSLFEEFELSLTLREDQQNDIARKWEDCKNKTKLWVEKDTKKGKKNVDVIPFIHRIESKSANSIRLLLDWRSGYINPLYIVRAVHPDLNMLDFQLCKTKQYFSEETA